MNELRRSLLSEEGVSDELPPDVRFLSAREGNLIPIFVDHVELYQHLITRYHREGTSPDLQAIALDAAGDLATILQSMRARQDLVNVIGQAPDRRPLPLLLVDQLFYCFTLLSQPCTEEDEEALLSPQGMHDTTFGIDEVRDWLARYGIDAPVGPPAGT